MLPPFHILLIISLRNAYILSVSVHSYRVNRKKRNNIRFYINLTWKISVMSGGQPHDGVIEVCREGEPREVGREQTPGGAVQTAERGHLRRGERQQEQ